MNLRISQVDCGSGQDPQNCSSALLSSGLKATGKSVHFVVVVLL